MVNIILVEKTGELKTSKYVSEKDELYKKCKFKKDENFVLRHSWSTKKDNFPFKKVSLYARDTGKANTENKYDFPPVDTILYFGCCALVAQSDNDEYVDLSIELWEKFYEDLFGGFENLADTAQEDENEEDELENVPAEMKTKSGYLKDGFVVEDNNIETANHTSSKDSSEENDWEDDTSSEIELEFEEYIYSDED
jgi:hypothetical protein